MLRTEAPWWEAVAASREADMELPGYLRRWALVADDESSVYLHYLQGPDQDVLHDHPWAFNSYILSGGYSEIYRDFPYIDPTTISSEPIHHKAGDFFQRDPGFAHYICSVEPNTWTLVVTGKRHKSWGFYVGDDSREWWMPHEVFVNSDRNERPLPIFRNGYKA